MLGVKAASFEAAFLCPWMDGMPQGAMDGGVAMSMDGRYVTKSQGWQCGYHQKKDLFVAKNAKSAKKNLISFNIFVFCVLRGDKFLLY